MAAPKTRLREQPRRVRRPSGGVDDHLEFEGPAVVTTHTVNSPIVGEAGVEGRKYLLTAI